MKGTVEAYILSSELFATDALTLDFSRFTSLLFKIVQGTSQSTFEDFLVSNAELQDLLGFLPDFLDEVFIGNVTTSSFDDLFLVRFCFNRWGYLVRS